MDTGQWTFAAEFSTVDLLLRSNAETRGIDAFALTIIKVERQLRRLFTFLVYQQPAFTRKDVPALRRALARNRKIFVEGFVRGFDAIYHEPLSVVVGAEYDYLHKRLDEARAYRNKVFHGQLTDRSLSRRDLVEMVQDLRHWSELVAENSLRAVGYDGFGRNSFRKSGIPDLPRKLRVSLSTVEEYEAFLRQYVQRA